MTDCIHSHMQPTVSRWSVNEWTTLMPPPAVTHRLCVTSLDSGVFADLEVHLWEKRLTFCISGLPSRRPEPATRLETSMGTSRRRGITNFLIWSQQSDVAPCNVNRPEVKHVEVLEGGIAALNCWFYVICGPTFRLLRRKLFVNKLL